MPYYHSLGAKYLQKFLQECKTSSSTPIFLTWETRAEKVSLTALESIIHRKHGSGGTEPVTIIKWIDSNIGSTTPIELWIVTDGEISTHDLQKCSQLNASLKMNYASLNFIIVSQSGRINMSVGAGFFSGSQLKIFMNEQILKEINTSKPFDYDKVTSDNFNQTIVELSDYIQAKFMGSEIQGLEEADKLNGLRMRLFAEIDKQEEKGQGQDNVIAIDWKDRDVMMKWLRGTKYYKNLTDSDIKDFRTNVDSSISTLVRDYSL